MIEQALSALVGQAVTDVRRVFYASPNGMDTSNGRIEFTVAAGTLALDSGADGESLLVETSPWVDPFDEDETPANAEFVRTHGKWEARDVGHDMRWSKIVGHVVRATEPIMRGATTVGAVVRFDAATVIATVVADEMIVNVE